MIRFDDRVAIVTGAGRGIGLSYAKALTERGARVIVHDVGVNSAGEGSDLAVAKHAAETLQSQGGNVLASAISVASREGCAALVTEALDAYGRLDILIHNAGWVGYQDIEALTPEFLSRAMAIQVEAPIWLAQAAWPAMKRQNYGRIVFTTSDRAIYRQYAQRGLSAYAVSKISQIGLMNILAAEAEETGIEVNAVSPVAKTRMWGVENEPDELKPDAIVPGVLYLSSEECCESSWIVRASNGQFHAVKWVEALDVSYPRDLAAVTCASVEDVVEKWSQIAAPQIESRFSGSQSS